MGVSRLYTILVTENRCGNGSRIIHGQFLPGTVLKIDQIAVKEDPRIIFTWNRCLTGENKRSYTLCLLTIFESPHLGFLFLGEISHKIGWEGNKNRKRATINHIE